MPIRPGSRRRIAPCRSAPSSKLRNLKTGRSVIVRINDRGPFVAGRIIDLTPAGAKAIGSDGLAPVALTVLGTIAPALAAARAADPQPKRQAPA